MRFHDYRTMKPAAFRGPTTDYIERFLMTPSLDWAELAKCDREESKRLRVAEATETMRAPIELSWLRHERPFYNVYPIAIELCQKTQLNMKWGDIMFPTKNILLRFAHGHEPLGIESVLLRVPSCQDISTPTVSHPSRFNLVVATGAIKLAGVLHVLENDRSVPRVWAYGEGGDIRDEVIGDTVALGHGRNTESLENPNQERDRINFIIRLLAFIGLLARGTDLITPAILSQDRGEYDATSDESRKRWLEDRAAKRHGRGFDIGRAMEIERATSPHWRSPHLALFHTGPGRTVPVLKVRSGCVVIPKDMSQVPTGYLGEEKPGEETADSKPVFRTPIPWRLRFKIMQRDGGRCRLCGMTAGDGVQMEIDHIVPVAKGGETTESNLWVLCKPCNGGKSDSDLNMTAQAK